MIRGMTGFGRGTASDGHFEVVALITSVNKRHLDITIRLPRGSQQEEFALRQLIGKHLSRGQITVSISVRQLKIEGTSVSFDKSYVENQLALLRAMADAADTQPMVDRAVFELWRRSLDDIENGELSTEMTSLMGSAVLQALIDLNKCRETEGAAIARELMERLQTLADAKQAVVNTTAGQGERIRQKMVDLLSKHVPTLPIDDRVLREVVLLADKADISEELSRIDHHIEQARKAIQSDGPVGKLLEFTLQELLREWNTMGSKTIDSNVSTCAVMAKTELEKMREQVQNVE